MVLGSESTANRQGESLPYSFGILFIVSPLFIFCCLIRIFSSVSLTIGKGKAVPLEAWSGPEGSRKLKFADLMTTAQDGGKFVSLTHRPPLPPGNTPGTHFC